jgi:hypothetical protein
MKIFVDIDGTICKSGGSSYVNAKPIPENIAKINRLYDEGNTIIYWTARGGTTGIDWSAITEIQLKVWGCKYHELDCKTKPSWDLLIDDKTMRIEEIS